MNPTLLYLVTEDWFFCSHFIERAKAARAAGYDVVVVTRVAEHGDKIRAAGLRLVPFNHDRRGINPLAELARLWRLVAIYRRERPALAHHVALKPVLYGTLAAWLARVPAIVNAPVGMGYVFSSADRLARLLRPAVSTALRLLLNPRGSRVVFENGDDLRALCARGFVRARDAVLIRGAGIDLDEFRPQPEPAGEPVVLLTARMLRDKGVAEFAEAARILRDAGVAARFRLVGAQDWANRAAIPEAVLRGWVEEGLVEWLGHRSDIARQIADSHVMCLPSYREGLPKSLLEAAAAGRPIVTCDVPGCREIVRDGDNGLLVPPRDAVALAAALKTLIESPELRARLGARGRRRAEEEFSNGRVVGETLELYRQLMPA